MLRVKKGFPNSGFKLTVRFIRGMPILPLPVGNSLSYVTQIMNDPNSLSGSVSWMDLTVGSGTADAQKVRDFYQQVVGWSHEAVDMGDYEDFCMQDASGNAVAGVCHAKGKNADIPTAWLIYITVDDVDSASKKCEASGGEVVRPASKAGEGRFAILKDPAGALFAVYQSEA
jgi:predicted enzyme related to lactoylglutathione lyase